MLSKPFHIPVMPDEVMAYLSPHAGGIYVDCTIGGGGHSKKILEVLGPDGKLIGIDQDPEAIEESTKLLSGYKNVRIVHANFSQLEDVLKKEHVKEVNGCLFDLGVSSHQLDNGQRGFSFRVEAHLDMRMDNFSGNAAYDLVNRLSGQELERIFREYGDERWARRISQEIVKIRGKKPIGTTSELAHIAERCIPGGRRIRKLHPATKIFMALRIAVNRELQALDEGINAAISATSEGGRIVVISYHSLEDRLVKKKFQELARRCESETVTVEGPRQRKKLFILTKKPLTPRKEEVSINPRARSAKFRAAEVQNIKEVNYC